MKIVAAVEIGVEDVYDLSVEHDDHSFQLSAGPVAHNCAYVIADRPIKEFIPLTRVSDVAVTQYTAKSVEAVGGLKMDFLGLNSLSDISDAVRMIQERSGKLVPDFHHIRGRGMVPKVQLVPHPKTGEWMDVWDLIPDQDVFNDVAGGHTETVFQFNTASARQWLRQFDYLKSAGVKAIDSIEAMSAFTALDRPGPLDAMVGQKDGKGGHNMMVEYANRAKGLAPTDPFPFLNERIPETYGVMVYQEQLQNIYQQLTDSTGIEANNFRDNIAKKKMDKVEKAYKPFIEKASAKIGQAQAELLWSLIVTWGQYGFNKSIDGDTILRTSEGEFKKIQEFSFGDRIQGVDENGKPIDTEVVALHDHGVLDGYEVEFDDGYKLVCSLDHKFLTHKGMMPLWQILKTDEEILCDPESGWVE